MRKTVPWLLRCLRWRCRSTVLLHTLKLLSLSLWCHPQMPATTLCCERRSSVDGQLTQGACTNLTGLQSGTAYVFTVTPISAGRLVGHFSVHMPSDNLSVMFQLVGHFICAQAQTAYALFKSPRPDHTWGTVGESFISWPV